MNLYQNIIAYCKEHEITGTEFARRCGLPQCIMSQWKRGYCKPSLKSLQKIAKATGVPLSEWLREAA